MLLIGVSPLCAQAWRALGPLGGDVRTLAIDPSHPERVFLGTADGHIFGSTDSGSHWALLGRAGTRLDSVITAIVVDPRDADILFAAAWTRDPPEPARLPAGQAGPEGGPQAGATAGGGVFQSRDGGHTWREAGLVGEAVRALARSPSDPDILAAGTLDGIYLSTDGSKTWERVSPLHDAELHNLDSLAFDPRDPQTLYAGTFHLPWKTSDRGRTWRPIHDGMIDDSDVMSLLVDSTDARLIYASACSGIYRSDDGAAQWRKIQGIPYGARRTYAIAQNPRHPERIYAATSEGLWITSDRGMSWRRTTPDSWVVNTVVVLEGETGRVLIGTEESGVLASDDGGEHFLDANHGFDHRQIIALGLDPNRPGRMLAVLARAPEPILETEDGGQSWSPLGTGLHPAQVLRIYAAPDGAWWASLAGGGLVRYDATLKQWKRIGMLAAEPIRENARVDLGSSKAAPKQVPRSRPLQEVVTEMAFSSNKWYAAAGVGLLISPDQGANWEVRPVRLDGPGGPLRLAPVQSVRVSPDGGKIRTVSLSGLFFSDDGGRSWSWHDLPLNSGGALRLYVDPDDDTTLIALARNGLHLSRDAGKTWQQAGSGLPAVPAQDSAISGGLYVVAMRPGGVYVSPDRGRTWERVSGTLAEGLFEELTPSNESGAVIAASSTDGLYQFSWTAGMAHDAHAAERVEERSPSPAR